jgi:hypothetical protein
VGITNHGNQDITYQYYEEASAKDFNKRNLSIQPKGIYSGGYLSRVSNTEILLTLLVAEIGDDNEQISVKTAIDAVLNSSTLDSGAIAPETPYIVLRWVFLEQENNYVEVHALATLNDVQANDIVVGKCVFGGETLSTEFLYTDRTFLNVQDLFLKVESTGVAGLYVRIRAGRIQNGSQYYFVPEQLVGAFDLPTAPNSRIDLVYVDTDGIVKIQQGAVAVSPSPPSYAGKLVLAEVRIANGVSSIPFSKITDVRSFLTSKKENAFGAWIVKSGNTVYLAVTDGFVSGYVTLTSGDGYIVGYTDSSNPPTTVRVNDYQGWAGGTSGMMMPVRKGDYWKVTGKGTITVNWLPIGV